MKKVIIFCSILIPSFIYGQSLDSLFFKTGKVVTGNFTFSEDKSFVFFSNDDSKEFYASTVDKFIKKGKIYLPIELFIDGIGKIFFAEKVLSGEISILEFEVFFQFVIIPLFVRSIAQLIRHSAVRSRLDLSTTCDTGLGHFS